ncbi:MAG: dockerin type I repeat-containing protein, partial [Muribaculaceae bacterium]|nr:dockerin type I repeat-containing protein [Muribaculaceae bacterium]
SDLEVYTPVMQPADEQYITLTSFRADWTDQTPAENVASYTLEVNTKPTEPEQPAYVLMENADFTGLTAQVNSSNQYSNQVSNASSFLPSGWTATTGLFIDDGAIITGELTQNSSSYAFTVGSNTYDFTGYDKVTVELDGSIFSESYGTSITLQVATSQGSQNVTINSTDFTTQSVVLACAASDKITLTGVSGLCCISGIRIYAGDKTAALNLLLATETGGPDYRLIEGLTPDKFYTVNDLTAGGTFLYRVKAIYTDGTESAWSNVEEVTLVETGHGYELGDVNHDGKVNIADVTRLIDYLLDNENVEICTICAEVKADGSINIGDVTALIDKLLTEGEETASINAPKAARKYRQLAF